LLIVPNREIVPREILQVVIEVLILQSLERFRTAVNTVLILQVREKDLLGYQDLSFQEGRSRPGEDVFIDRVLLDPEVTPNAVSYFEVSDLNARLDRIHKQGIETIQQRLELRFNRSSSYYPFILEILDYGFVSDMT